MIYKIFIESSLQEAAQIATESFGKVSGVTKGLDNNQVLTETDLAVGKLLIEKVKQTYPDYNIIDEEAGVIDNGSDFTWVIDPIDGTSNFANGVPTYGIMIGLLHNTTPIAGGTVLPYFDQLIIAEKGKGTFLNDTQIFVTKETNLLKTLVAYHIDGHQENPERTQKEARLLGEIVLACRNVRTSGCEPIDGVLVAEGKYGALLNQSAKIWDVVTMQIIIEEAGGIYSDFWGKPIDYTNPLTKVEQNYTLCAAAPELHKQLQKIIQKKEN